MPDRPDGAEDSEAEDSGAGESSAAEETDTANGGGASCSDARPTESDHADDTEPDTDAEARRRIRLAAAERRYRAILRNEADTGGGGFSEDYYRSQKPPHWS